MLHSVLLFGFGVAATLVAQTVLLAVSSRARALLGSSRIGLHVRRRVSERRRIEVPSAQWSTTLGRLSFPWVVVAAGPFAHDEITSVFEPNAPDYPDPVQDLLTDVSVSLEARHRAGERVPPDEPGWKLTGFSLRPLDAGRAPTLVLRFAPTSRYLMLATELQLDREITVDGERSTLRRLYVQGRDLRLAPIPELATFWGVGLAVVTADHRLVLARRSPGHAESGAVIWPAVGEGGAPGRDADARGAPDHFEIARRGTQEELGVPLAPSELMWLALGASANEGAYGLIGRASIPLTLAELRKRRSAGVASHAMENTELIDAAMDPDAVVELLNREGLPVSPFALATIMHSLIVEFGFTRVDRAFSAACFAVSTPDAHGAHEQRTTVGHIADAPDTI